MYSGSVGSYYAAGNDNLLNGRESTIGGGRPSSLQARLLGTPTTTSASSYNTTPSSSVSLRGTPLNINTDKTMIPEFRRISPTSVTSPMMLFDTPVCHPVGGGSGGGGFVGLPPPPYTPSVVVQNSSLSAAASSFVTPIPNRPSIITRNTTVGIKPKYSPYQSSGDNGSGSGGRGGGSRNRRSSNASGRSTPVVTDGETNPAAPTPQNLRDNPERLAKVKSEMCHYYEKGGAKACPFGANCNYAHGKHELKFRYTTLCLMENSGQIVNAKSYLARPCMTWVSTGACPFGRRCTGIHDPSISGPAEYPSWLPAATAKTNAQIIVDRLGAHRDSTVHQENPLISQSIWENCRPSHHGRGDHPGGTAKGILESEQEFRDTYDLVCNSNVSAFTGGVRSKSIPLRKVSELQKLCIVRLMHTTDQEGLSPAESSQLHRDYVFTPTHSLHSELCMILQARYFLLADINYSTGNVSSNDIVKEISLEEYTARTTPWSDSEYSFNPGKVVTAHEIAFAPKGDSSANVSVWFDAVPIKLEQSQIKRSRRLKQKKKTQIKNGHVAPNSNGALISRTCSADFPCGSPEIDPFVPMLPAQDNEDSRRLLMAIMEHRIDSIILENSSSDEGLKKRFLHNRMEQLQTKYFGMAKFHQKWVWPKRSGLERVTSTTKAPPGNIMPYIPSPENVKDKKSPCFHWSTFVKAIGSLDAFSSEYDDDNEDAENSRFVSPNIMGRETNCPRLASFKYDWWNKTLPADNADATWKELMFFSGKWEKALTLHLEKKRSSSFDNTIGTGRNTPLSTIPFVVTN